MEIAHTEAFNLGKMLADEAYCRTPCETVLANAQLTREERIVTFPVSRSLIAEVNCRRCG